MTSTRWWASPRTAAFALAAAALGIGTGFLCLWGQSGAFWPEAIPPQVQYLGEGYACVGLPAPDTLKGLTLQGHTPGGGLVYAHPPIGSKAPYRWIVVTDGHRRETCLDVVG